MKLFLSKVDWAPDKVLIQFGGTEEPVLVHDDVISDWLRDDPAFVSSPKMLPDMQMEIECRVIEYEGVE